MSSSSAIKPGKYRHYKGGEYQVFETARHSETEEQLVVYRCLYGDFSWWVRPLALFVDTLDVDGKSQPRFEYIGPLSSDDTPVRGS